MRVFSEGRTVNIVEGRSAAIRHPKEWPSSPSHVEMCYFSHSKDRYYGSRKPSIGARAYIAAVTNS